MAISQYYVDPAIAGNSGTGTIGDPYGDLQYALNTITRNASDGDQINVKAGTAEVLAASLTLATYGTPAKGKPLILRGYTSAANDGGTAEINCNGNKLWTSAAYGYIMMVHLKMHTFGDNHGILLNGNYGQLIYQCEISRGSSTPSGKYLVNTLGETVGCYIHDAGTNGGGIYAYGPATDNYIVDCPYGILLSLARTTCNGNIIKNATIAGITGGADNQTIFGNVVYASAATGTGIICSAEARAYNNIVAGYSGVGGKGMSAASAIQLLDANAFYNCATAKSLGAIYVDRATDITLLADPFANAAAGDFSLTDAAKTALRSLGWPPLYLGAHANTDPHVTIGPLQYGPTPAASGGGPIFGGMVVR